LVDILGAVEANGTLNNLCLKVEVGNLNEVEVEAMLGRLGTLAPRILGLRCLKIAKYDEHFLAEADIIPEIFVNGFNNNTSLTSIDFEWIADKLGDSDYITYTYYYLLTEYHVTVNTRSIPNTTAYTCILL